MDVKFARSTDMGLTWSDPVRVNDDPEDNGAWQWFATMSVAPNGRIDAVWNDTRNSGLGNISELFYSFSLDTGVTWSKNIPLTPAFDSHVGWPSGQQKLGDYYHMISDNAAVNIAYAATFNGEQDIYFLRVGDCNDNGIHDSADIAEGRAMDCNQNTIPDECEPGDFTGDVRVALDDLAALLNCQTAPCADPSCDPHCNPPLYGDPCCALGDFNSDGDVDLSDFAAFQNTLTGP